MPSQRPNVIIIMTDDQGYGDLGCHGNPIAITPCLDQLHSESVRLADFHAAPMCTATRGQLLTGIDAARNGAVNVSSGRSLLRKDLPTMADHFKAGGYRTGLFGKWHLGDNYPFRPQDRGFEETLWFPSSHISSAPDYWENDYFDDVYCRNGKRELMEGYCTEVFFREAQKWMKQCIDNDEPFLAWLPTNAPHAPWFAPKADIEATEAAFDAGKHLLPEQDQQSRSNITRFLSLIRNVDTQVGLLRKFLAREGVEQNTLLIFATDNGSTLGPTYYNAGMKGAKCTLWEGGHRVPCFWHWPDGQLGASRDIDGLTEMQDILPTIAEFCDVPIRSVSPDGISLASALRGKEPVPTDRILPINYSRMPFGSEFNLPSPNSPAIMQRDEAAILWRRWRLLEGNSLYNLDDDPLQEKNIIDEHPEVAKRLQDALNQWWSEVEATANEPQEIIVGSDEENPMMLSCCEWWDVFLDQQKQIRAGSRKNSFWHLHIERAGAYRFELRRWPVEADLALTDPCLTNPNPDWFGGEGAALPIARARLSIGQTKKETEVSPGDKAATFTVDLEKGSTQLQTCFDDANAQPICGAYYVYITHLS